MEFIVDYNNGSLKDFCLNKHILQFVENSVISLKEAWWTNRNTARYLHGSDQAIKRFCKCLSKSADLSM